MTKKISLVASAMLLSSTVALADSASIKDAFKAGTVSGDITVHSTSVDASNVTSDTGFTAGTIGLNYETATYKGFKLMAGFRAAHEFAELNQGDYDGSFADDSIMHTAAISYANDDFFVSVGRQAVDLEWIGDYNEAVVAGVTAIENTTIVAAYADRQAATDEDEMAADFADLNGTKGVYLVDVKNTSIDMVELNAYYYDAPNLSSWYGLKAGYANDMFGLTAHYAASDEETAGDKDGSILHLAASTEVAGISLAAGYITTDDDGDVGSMSAAGDNIDPTDSIGDQVYSADADTYYISAGYSVAGIDLSAQYSDVEYGSANTDADELYLTAGYSFSDELSLLIEYTDYEVATVETDEISATLTYSF